MVIFYFLPTLRNFLNHYNYFYWREIIKNTYEQETIIIIFKFLPVLSKINLYLNDSLWSKHKNKTLVIVNIVSHKSIKNIIIKALYL
jgi:hypothetical protein